ncbi:MAG: Hsp20 family protein [Thermoanaerobaculia bacterium]|jgi:HSP20 family molecular chaperone IbpA|nr:Hsp20 family protein [Thermoanaerobaculia bacterium]
MSRPGSLGNPFCLGFEDVERLIERIARTSSDAYPPMNVEEPEEGRLRLTLAVAGFAPESLSVTLSDRELTVRGERPQPVEGRVFLHKGIAARGFQRSFILADGWEVEGAHLANGLLSINLKRIRLTQQIRQISITLG